MPKLYFLISSINCTERNSRRAYNILTARYAYVFYSNAFTSQEVQFLLFGPLRGNEYYKNCKFPPFETEYFHHKRGVELGLFTIFSCWMRRYLSFDSFVHSLIHSEFEMLGAFTVWIEIRDARIYYVSREHNTLTRFLYIILSFCSVYHIF